MNWKTFKKDFRMTAREFERFDRVRRSQGFGFRPWSEFIRDALVKYVEEFEARHPGRFPPAVTPPSLVEHFREHIREKPTPLPAEPAKPAGSPTPVTKSATKKKAAAKAK